MNLDLYAAYLLVCFVATVTPGPTNTLIVANGMRHGVPAALMNVAGTQAGLAVMIACVGLGITSLIETAGHWFEWIKLAGAAYLVWIGWKMFRSGGTGREAGALPRPKRGFFVQGLLVSLGNPKQLIFFGALLPQFIDPAGDYALQIAILGGTAIMLSILSDGTYAIASGRLARGMTARREKLVARIGGSFLIGGGLWLAATRAR